VARGSAAHLIDPRDEAGWREAMHRAATDDEWIGQLARGAEEAARPFTWERCATVSWQTYRLLAGSAPPARRAA
jgi:glycosyltransferase involved in cell wall biosynthesis